MTDVRAHWDDTYRTRAETVVSWYQPHLAKSLALIRAAQPAPSAAIVDIGGGASTLVDSLLDAGYVDVTVLDLSDVGLGRSKERLGPRAAAVHWTLADVTRWRPARRYDVWHDRAVFHFLTADADQDRYLAALELALAPGGTVIMATFAPDGPERCSGLPVQRYGPDTLAARLGAGYVLAGHEGESHVTPAGRTQPFIYAVLRRR